MPYLGNNHIAGDHVNNFKVLDDISSYTATFDGSATSVVDTTNNTIRVVEHRFIQGQRVTYTNGSGGNIGGLTTGTAYFVIYDSASTFKLATNASNAANSTAINLSSVGSGTSHTLNAAFDGTNTKFKLTHGSGVGARLNNATQLNVAINNVVQRPNQSALTFTEGFAIEDNHKIVFKVAPTNEDIFWGSIIANTITTFDISDHKIDTFTGDGSTTEFTLSHTPANNESLMVTINGVLQHPSNASTARAYTLIASIIQFTAAPGVGDEIQVRHLGFAGATTADVSGFYGRTGNVVLTDQDDIIVNKISVGTGATIESNGQATFVGVVTFGSSSTTIEGDNNLIKVGTALTLGHTQGLQFHTQNLHSAGFEINNINASGIITASQFVGNIGGNPTFSGDTTFNGSVSIGGTLTYEDVTNIDSIGIVTARDGLKVLAGGANIVGVVTANTFKGDGDFVDIDVDGHTNLDNVSIAGVTTFASNISVGSSIAVGTGVTIESNGQATFSGITTFAGNINLIGELNTDTARIRLPDGMNGGPFTGNLELGNSRDFVMLHDGHHNYVKVAQNMYIFCNSNNLITLQTGGTVLVNKDLDVDGHTNLDNVSVAGVTTITSAAPELHFTDTNADSDYSIVVNTGQFRIRDETNSANRFAVNSDGHSDFYGRLDANSGLQVTLNATFNNDIDVDGHTNLDNVNIVGVTTTNGNVQIGNGDLTFLNNAHKIHNASSSGNVTIQGGSTYAGGRIVMSGGYGSGGGTGDIKFYADSTTTPVERLHITSTGNLQFNTTANGQAVILKSTGNYYNKLSFDSGNTSAGGELAYIDFSWDGDKVADIYAEAGSDTTNKDDGHLVFRTSHQQGNIAERLRIDSSGDVTIKNHSAGGGLILDSRDSTSNYSLITGNANRASADYILTGIRGDWNSDSVAAIYLKTGADNTNKDDGEITFHTQTSGTNTLSERLRITSGGVVKIGGDVSNASSDVGTVTKLTIKQHTNTHEGGMYIERSGERRGFYMYVGGAGGLNDALCITTNQLGTDTNVLGIDRSNRLTKLGGDVVIDNSNNGYGGLRIVDSSAGEYSVNYIAGRNSGATAHVFSIGGRTQNSSPWANASQSECARISQRGISFNGDDAQANALDDYEEGSYTPNVQTDNGVNAGLAVGQGYYVKVGKVVTVHLKIETNSHNSVNTTGQYKVSLPFLSLAQGDTQGTLMCSIWSIGSSSISWMGGQVHNNNAWTHIAYHNGSNNNTNNLTPQLANNQLQFRGTVVYRSNV